MSSGKWKPSCLGLDVLSHPGRVTHVCVSKLHPSPKVMADFFQRQKLPWCPYPICTIFGGFIKHMNVFIFCAKYIDFLNQPVLHRGSKCDNVILFKSSLNIIVNFIEWDLTDSDEIIETLFLTRTNVMAIGLTVTKSFAEKCRSLCTLIGKCVHAKVMVAIFGHKNQHDALIQFAYMLVDLYGICSWSILVNRMEIKPVVFMQHMLELT